jgi:hypothetical protein
MSSKSSKSVSKDLQGFYGLKPMKKVPEMGEVTRERSKGSYCEYCGCGNFELRLQPLFTIRTRVEESYIIKKCKNEDCQRDQQPIN